jgi:hypothetical protein
MSLLKRCIQNSVVQAMCISAFLSALILWPVLAVAQGNDDIFGMLNQSLGVVSTWKAAGWIAGMTAGTNLLVNITKIPAIERFLGVRFWMRPILSMVFSTMLASLSSLAGGVPVGTAIVGGLIAGLSNGGMHELATVFNDKVQAERSIGGKIVEAVHSTNSPEALVLATTALAEVAKLPEADRAAALIAWADKHQTP